MSASHSMPDRLGRRQSTRTGNRGRRHKDKRADLRWEGRTRVAWDRAALTHLYSSPMIYGGYLLHQVLQPIEIHDLGSWDPESSAIIVPVPIAIPAGTGYGCAMYIRRTTIKSRQTGEPYYTYRLVESIRVGKQVRQRTLLNLGRRFEVPREQWPALVQRIEHLVGGQQDLMPADLDAQWDEAAQRYAAQLIRARASVDESGSGAGADYHTVDVDSLQLLRPRSVAIEEVITLYDLTNTYFEGTAQGNANAHLGKSKEKRSDCPLVTLALVLDASGFPKRSEIFAGNISEPKTLSKLLDKLVSGHTDTAPTVVLDAGIATEENIAWLVENGYRYLVVSRKRQRRFDPDAAVLIKERENVTIRAQRCINAETGEVELYCHSSQRENKERGIAELFAKRFEAALEKLAEGLHKKGAVKRYEKVLERLGRLRQKYSRAAQYYEIRVEKDPPSGKATAIHWQRTTPIAETLPGVYCLRTNQEQWDEATLWRTYTMLTDLEAVFRCLKSELGLRPIFHRKTDRVSGHLFISVLAYHLVHTIRFQLKAAGIHLSWEGVRRALAGQDRVTVTLKRADGKTVHIRKSTRAEPRQQVIYDALGISDKPGRTEKTIA